MTQYCQKCRDFHGTAPTCEQFEVCFPETDPDGWRTIWAWDAEEAAQKMAEKHDCDSAEYEIARRGSCDRVQVRSVEEGSEIREFSITAEQTVIYTAHEITPITEDRAEGGKG